MSSYSKEITNSWKRRYESYTTVDLLTLNEKHNTFNLSIKDKSVVPTGDLQCSFTS